VSILTARMVTSALRFWDLRPNNASSSSGQE
jgi:hypothetical protein